MSKEKGGKNLSGAKDLARDIRTIAQGDGLEESEGIIRSRAGEPGNVDENLESLVGRELDDAGNRWRLGATRLLSKTSHGDDGDTYGPVARPAEHEIVAIYDDDVDEVYSMPFEPIKIKDGLVTHEPGTFSFIVPEEDAPIEVTTVAIGGVAMDADITPELEVAIGQVVYLHFKTDYKGKPIAVDEAGSFAELVTDEAFKTSTHFNPKDNNGGGGIDGEYWVEIYSLTGKKDGDGNEGAGVQGAAPGDAVVNSGSPTRYGNYDWSLGYQQIVNLGGDLDRGADPELGLEDQPVAGVYGSTDKVTGELKLRSIAGDFGIKATERASDIGLEFDAENVGLGESSYGAEVFIDDPLRNQFLDKAKFRRFLNIDYEDSYEAQPTIGVDFEEKDDNIIATVANPCQGGMDLNLIVTQKGYKRVTVTDTSDYGSSTSYLNMMQHDYTSSASVTYYWRKGIYVGTANPGDGRGIDAEVDNWTDTT